MQNYLYLIPGTESQGYEAMVNTRGLIVIEHENSTIGKVAVIPIGITEISSITITVKEGQQVEKGDELGYFSYGGSSMALVFQKDTIKEFTAKEPEPDQEPPLCKDQTSCSTETGCLMVRGKIALAN